MGDLMSTVLEQARLNILDRTLDPDGHEMAPSHLWGQIFGPSGRRIAELTEPMLKKLGGNNIYNPDLKDDSADITHDNVWHIRGTGAPAASRRVGSTSTLLIISETTRPPAMPARGHRTMRAVSIPGS